MKPNLNSIRLFLLRGLLCLFLPACLSASPDNSSDGFKYFQAWMDNFHGRPLDLLSDERALIRLWFVPGTAEGLTNPLAAPLTDCLALHADKAHLWGGLSTSLCLEEAEVFKGSKLSEEETASLDKLFSDELAHFLQTHEHYMAMDVFKSAAAINLQSTLGEEYSLPNALALIARQHHLACDYLRLESPSEVQILQLLREGTPLLLEKPDAPSSQERWLLVFAAYRDDSGILQLLANIPGRTTMAAWRDRLDDNYFIFGALTQHDIDSYRPQYPSEFFPSDQCSHPDKRLLETGFALISLPLDGFICHIMRNWHPGLEAFSGELQDILPAPAAEPATVPPPSSAQSSQEELWQYYFHQERSRAGLDFQASFLPSLTVFTCEDSSLLSCLLSSLATQQPDFKCFIQTATTCWRLYCDHQGQRWIPLTPQQIDTLNVFCEKRRRGFNENFGEISRHAPLAAQLSHCVPALLPARDLPQALDKLENLFGWQFSVASGTELSWPKCRLAVQSHLPLLIRHRQTGEYCLGLGYLEFQGQRLLLVLHPELLTGDQSLKHFSLLSSRLPAACEFLDYDSACSEITCLGQPSPSFRPVRQEILNILPSSDADFQEIPPL